ncbi:hypothetical protein BABINDRAFT_178316 [Babjeviella inositovora NRRL Y-12698]|uniref:Hyphally-regulated cell wall protein N-terminal domain-containing protein n=1 Tax=Babjeviella inositovora NRRL Y-12698 TaxID=984486 RepID=A0A1E3QJM2_9ASCO|nr:uncharacterized protein BABINDRAFT_178316 [Babjeviella inositovora NRRL Y-12698]ODQ77197.1 hypothetical protein BABINDRAFT_178316 [Babjeviella inositovora NRRL Y-12698]
MRSFTTIALLSLAASLVSAASENFGILDFRSASPIHFSTWSVQGDDIYINAGTQLGTLQIQDDTTVKTTDGKFLVVNGDNSLGVGAKGTPGFSIISSSDGSPSHLTFGGSTGFSACNDGSSSAYQIFTTNTGANCLGFQVGATGEGTAWADAFPQVGTTGEGKVWADALPQTVASSSPTLLPTSYSNTTTTTTEQWTTATITITSCSDQKCVTTLTVTTCPVTDLPTGPIPPPNTPAHTTSPVGSYSNATTTTTEQWTTATVTVTSCSDHKCITSVTVTTCPVTALTSTAAPATVSPKPTTTPSPAPKPTTTPSPAPKPATTPSPAPKPTTTPSPAPPAPKPTTTPTPTTLVSSASKLSTSHSVITQTGAAASLNKVAGSVGAGVLMAGLMFV